YGNNYYSDLPSSCLRNTAGIAQEDLNYVKKSSRHKNMADSGRDEDGAEKPSPETALGTSLVASRKYLVEAGGIVFTIHHGGQMPQREDPRVSGLVTSTVRER
ncbi:mCG20833, partial [Mus musculus]